LENIYPKTIIVALGVASPAANIHGENENMDLSFVKKLTKTISYLVGEFGAH
jgi:acetylornithine deacetylase/succinyl-diaminopimelate desuccinylase-like protein